MTSVKGSITISIGGLYGWLVNMIIWQEYYITWYIYVTFSGSIRWNRLSNRHYLPAFKHASIASRHPPISTRHPSISSRYPSISCRHLQTPVGTLQSLDTLQSPQSCKLPSIPSRHPSFSARHPSISSRHPSISSRHRSISSWHSSISSRLSLGILQSLDILRSLGILQSHLAFGYSFISFS